MAGAGQTLVQRTDHVVHQIHNGEQILLMDGVALGDHLIALIIIDVAGKDIHLAGAGLIMIWGKRREIHRFRFFRRQPHRGDTYFMASPPVAELALDQVCSSAAQSRSASFFVHFSFFPEASVVQT